MEDFKIFEGLELTNVSNEDSRIGFHFKISDKDKRYGNIFFTKTPCFFIRKDYLIETIVPRKGVGKKLPLYAFRPNAIRSGFWGFKWWISYILALILLGAASWLLYYS